MKERLGFEFKSTLEMMERAGIRQLVTDDDDTLRPTGKMIVEIMWQYSDLVADKLGIDASVVMGLLRKHNDRLFSTHFVRPDRWVVASDMVGYELVGDPMALRDEAGKLMTIYDMVPDLYLDVMPIMRMLNNNGFRIFVVTHAPLDWALLKSDKTGLSGVIDGLFAADVGRAKGKQDYARCLEMSGSGSNQTVGSGDSVKGDAIPMVELGFRAVLMLPSVWHVTHAETPAGAVSIGRYGDFFDGVGTALAGKI